MAPKDGIALPARAAQVGLRGLTGREGHGSVPGTKPWPRRPRLSLRRGGLRAAASPCRCVARRLAGAGVAEVSLLRTATSVGVRQAERGALSFADFLATVVANENCLASQVESSYFERIDGIVVKYRAEFYAAARDCRMRHERSKERSARSSASRPISRAPTTRK